MFFQLNILTRLWKYWGHWKFCQLLSQIQKPPWNPYQYVAVSGLCRDSWEHPFGWRYFGPCWNQKTQGWYHSLLKKQKPWILQFLKMRHTIDNQVTPFYGCNIWFALLAEFLVQKRHHSEIIYWSWCGDHLTILSPEWRGQTRSNIKQVKKQPQVSVLIINIM